MKGTTVPYCNDQRRVYERRWWQHGSRGQILKKKIREKSGKQARVINKGTGVVRAASSDIHTHMHTHHKEKLSATLPKTALNDKHTYLKCTCIHTQFISFLYFQLMLKRKIPSKTDTKTEMMQHSKHKWSWGSCIPSVTDLLAIYMDFHVES